MLHTIDHREHADGIGVPALERFWTPQQIAASWQVDEGTVRRIFADEPGVLRLATRRRGKRAYVTLRIPENVLERVRLERTRR